MASLDWDDSLATGDATIDAQHREISELTRQLAALVEEGAGRAATQEVLSGLMRYVLTHFTDEEALMKRVGYPLLDRQRVQHEEYRTTAARLAAGFIDGQVSARTVLDYMLAWWNDHICGEDLEMARWIRERASRGYDA